MADAAAYHRIRDALDAELGAGDGLSVAEAAERIASLGADAQAAHAVWVLDNLLACLFDHRLHIWDQSFAQGDYPGPRVVSALAEQMRALDPLIADQLRWTMRWVTDRGVALVSLPPHLWDSSRAEAHDFILGVAERWPKDVDPAALPAPEPWGGPPSQPGKPKLAEVGAHLDAIFQDALRAAWLHGVSDGALERFWEDYYAPDADEVAVLREFVDIELSDEALRARIRPPDPLMNYLGVERLGFPCFIRVPSIEALEPHLGDWHARILPGEALGDELRVAARSGADFVVFEAAKVGPAEAEKLFDMILAGLPLIAAGESAPLDAMLSRLEGAVAIVDRR